jgi:anti-sigma28 factor (negative regulator of flagellin synthesis)
VKEQPREAHARHRKRAVEAVTAQMQLQKLVDRERRMIDFQQDKARTAARTGNESLRQDLERDAAFHLRTLTELEERLARATAAAEAIQQTVSEECAQIRVDAARALEAIQQAEERAAEEGREEFAPEDVALDKAVRRMREEQMRNRDKAVRAITSRNNLAQLAARERQAVGRLRTELAKQTGLNDRRAVEAQERELRLREAALQDLMVRLAAAEAAVEEIKQAIRDEDERLRSFTAEAMQRKTIRKADELLDSIKER